MNPTNPHCVGVDGARSGWIAVWRDGAGLAFARRESAAALATAHAKAQWVAVDIPIGLPEQGGRTPDVLARRFVGGKRSRSVFSAPVRGVLDATTQSEASYRHRQIDGRGFGAQAFGILPKIREWDSVLRANPDFRRRVREIHPEVSFAAMNSGLGLAASKKSPEGQAARIDLLGRHFGESPVRSLLAAVPRSQAAPDDVLDALVGLWTAERLASGVAKSLPSPPEQDSAGLTMAIWY